MIEDLHWMDEGSEALLAETGRRGRGHRRPWRSSTSAPSTSAAWTGLAASTAGSRWSRSGRTRHGELLRDLAGDDPSLDGLAELIHERTGGNPFFIEEIVRELAEAGNLEGERGAYRLARPVEDTGVPATVQAILAARIDRLGRRRSGCCRWPR